MCLMVDRFGEGVEVPSLPRRRTLSDASAGRMRDALLWQEFRELGRTVAEIAAIWGRSPDAVRAAIARGERLRIEWEAEQEARELATCPSEIPPGAPSPASTRSRSKPQPLTPGERRHLAERYA